MGAAAPSSSIPPLNPSLTFYLSNTESRTKAQRGAWHRWQPSQEAVAASEASGATRARSPDGRSGSPAIQSSVASDSSNDQRCKGPFIARRRASATARALCKMTSKNKNGRNIGIGMGDGAVPLEEHTAVLLTALMRPYCCLRQRVCGASMTPTTSSFSWTLDQQLGTGGNPDGVVHGYHQVTHRSADALALAPLLEPFVFEPAQPRRPKASAGTATTSSATTWMPSMTACFDEGLLYRVEWRRAEGADAAATEVVGGKNTHVLWCFFNATHVYTMEIHVSFPVSASWTTAEPLPLKALGMTQMEWADAQEDPGSPLWHRRRLLVARAACPPLSCVAFVEGTVGPFRTAVRAVPLSTDAPLSVPSPTSTWRARLEAELHRLPRPLAAMAAPVALSGNSVTEAVLNACVAANIPFVDADFLAGEMALCGTGTRCTGSVGHDGAPFTSPFSVSHHFSEGLDRKPVAWARASDLVRRLFGEPNTHSALQPHVFFLPLRLVIIEPGELGDSWVIGAMAAVAEHTHHLLRMFRHPRSQQQGAAEQLLGAYRVTLNVRGWWRSVVVDDYFPMIEGGSYINCAHSRRDVRELWVPLLEKVYAKMRGGYSNIITGDPLMALRDFTGWPCARYDISHFNDISVVSSSFASRLMRYDRYGFQVILHTAPRFDPDAVMLQTDVGISRAEMSLPSAAEASGRGACADAGAAHGLLAGMVYPVMRILRFNADSFCTELTLLQVRNPWGDVAAWKGKWRCGSRLWEQWPHVAAACDMQECLHRDGSGGMTSPRRDLRDRYAAPVAPQTAATAAGATTTACACRHNQYIWVEWSEVYQHFSGCGVMFRLPLHHDYRVKGVFETTCPSVCVRVSVAARTFMGAMLSMSDTVVDRSLAATDTEDASTYPPIMLTLAREEAGVLHVVRNSQTDPDNPTTRFTFMQTLDASLFYPLTPEDSPYWLIPRVLAPQVPNAAAAADGGANAPAPHPPRLPYVLGLFQEKPAGENGWRAEFYHLPPTSAVFQNHTSFSLGSDVQAVATMFQAKAPHAAFPKTYVHTEVSEREATPVDVFAHTAQT
ncbi:Calpain cysteine protease family protein [Leishmania donovani]|uniref:Calpain cysteine protease family protein n=1 Tax=Leishmania donovani TaxID=5661 RepID=A0A504XRD5_LEIDO|nr:Calpain cysteine protease family protein [Leishmania donovani]